MGRVSRGLFFLVAATGRNMRSREKESRSHSVWVSLVAYRRAYGKSHREIALVLNNLAALYHKTGQYVRAETHYRAALTMKRRELGKSHPDLAITMNNLAILLASVGNAKLARRFFQNAMKVFAMSLGNAHAHTLGVKKNLRRIQT